MNKKQSKMASACLYPVARMWTYTIEDEFLKQKSDADLKQFINKQKKIYENESKPFYTRSLAKARHKTALNIIHKRNKSKDSDEIKTSSTKTTSPIQSKIEETLGEMFDDFEIVDQKITKVGYHKIKVNTSEDVERLTFTEEGALLDRKLDEDDEDEDEGESDDEDDELP